MERLSDFRFSEDASDDLRLCIAAYDRNFGGDVIPVEICLDAPSDHDEGMKLVNKIVAALNQ